MFNSAAIEVVIGLTFIYILYSLLVTIIVELAATMSNMRGKMLIKGIKRMLDDDDGLTFSEDFLKRPEIKYLQHGKRLPSYINPATFARTMVNLINTSDNTQKFLKENIKKYKDEKEGSETKTIIYSFLVEADGDLDKFKSLLENWYNETMDRVVGWYKRHLLKITWGVAIFIAFAFSVDTIAIAKNLSRDSNARSELVKMASDYVNNVDTEQIKSDTTTSTIADSLKAELKDVLNNVRAQKSIVSISYPGGKSSFTDVLFWILGCLVTAIALSLGAPFWFDILNKLVKLRGSGTQEKTDNKKPMSSDNRANPR